MIVGLYYKFQYKKDMKRLETKANKVLILQLPEKTRDSVVITIKSIKN
ncbi:hypothetical protein SAMN05661012_04165 [Chitinophaga sancti]|uniref:Uncharacterized protein n=1 Tax=Chitinophaga sancti TaxID=1004 RepID=A0A1K1RQB0_9BACT|nr:hypothetical protein SAMN05661012_04165 [Chitinophaga sancti]